MTKYLYGAAVQGIQGFIFQTNKLKEIVGASEMVEDICTLLFAREIYPELAAGSEKPDEDLKNKLVAKLNDNPNAVLNAAGNIKYIFDSEEECQRVVRSFPMKVMQYAPGITISQSVVAFDDDFGAAVQKLEYNLRIQRNKPMPDLNIGLMATLRSRDTGLPVSHIRKNLYLDSGSFYKLYTDAKSNVERKDTTQYLCRKIFGDKVDKSKLPVDIEKFTADNDWIAVIHADGNGLGQVVQKIGRLQSEFKDFSVRLNKATITAAMKAYEDIGSPIDGGFIPMRPIVLGGDDLTIICRGDLAVPFTQAFLKHFEDQTKSELSGHITRHTVFADRSNYLTACAGIAFVKSSYPFHFAYNLAEALCDRAKKDTKRLAGANEGNLPPSCLMYHKVQDSFVSDFNDIADRELHPQPNISFEFGPYYLRPVYAHRWTIDHLRDMSDRLSYRDGNAVKSHLRQWLSLLHDDPQLAAQKLKRLKTITDMKDYVEKVTDTEVRRENGVSIYPVYDILALLTINTQKTR